jgi:hypothetical protein
VKCFNILIHHDDKHINTIVFAKDNQTCACHLAMAIKDGQWSSPFQMKLILFILWSWFKVGVSNGVHNSILFNFKKNVPTLTSYIPLDAPFKSQPWNEYFWNREDPIP